MYTRVGVLPQGPLRVDNARHEPDRRRPRDPKSEREIARAVSKGMVNGWAATCWVSTEIDQTQVAVVGGKGAHLGELSRIEGVRVPAGFCVTTDVFRRIMADAPSIEDRFDRLSRLTRTTVRRSARSAPRSAGPSRGSPSPAIWRRRSPARSSELGEHAAYAVRSSATAEDLPTASFAGQQDTYLNVVGTAAILEHVSRCWASLFTERAVTYRLRNGFDHREVHMAVVVQQMVFPRAAGVLFTADPVTSNRRIVSVEASFGLGEALVSGLVNAGRLQGA